MTEIRYTASLPEAEWTKWRPERVAGSMGRNGHSGLLDFRYDGHGDDWIELSFAWRADLVAVPETGIIASGAVISLMDIAAARSVWTRLKQYRPHVTIDLRVDYLRASPAGQRVYGWAQCYRLTRSVAFVRGVAHNGDRDDPIANVAATFLSTLGYLS